MSFDRPKIPTVRPAPNTPTQANASIVQAGQIQQAGYRPLITGKMTGLASKAKGLKRSLIGGQ